MEHIVSIILSVIGGGAVTSLVLLRGKKRTSDTQSYQLLIDDLNGRMATALNRMRELEAEINRVSDENRSLRDEIATLRRENENLKTENDRLKKTVQ